MTQVLGETQQDMVFRGMELWRAQHHHYTHLVEECDCLREKVKELGLSPGKRPTQSIIKGLPRIELFCLEAEDSAMAYLAGLSLYALKLVINEIEDILNFDRSYRTLRAYEIDLRHKFRCADKIKSARSSCAMDPDFRTICSSSSKTRRRPV